MLEYTSRRMDFQKITDEFIKVESEKVKKLDGLIKRKNSRKKILETLYIKSNYKSLRAGEKASKHYARGVRKLSNELKEMNVIKHKAGPNECLYGLISELWSYWGKGYILPLLKYDIDISRQGDTFIVERGENGNN